MADDLQQSSMKIKKNLDWAILLWNGNEHKKFWRTRGAPDHEFSG